MTQGRREIAAIFAHPDDEVLGCGGALAEHARRGDRVRILLLAAGLDSRGSADAEAHAAHARMSDRAAAILGAAEVKRAGLPDNAMDGLPLLRIVQTVESFLAEAPPDMVYTHHAGDLNIDHRLTHQAVVTACRPVGPKRTTILAGEVLSSTEWAGPGFQPFEPSVFVPIPEGLAVKLDAMRAYAGELRDFPHARSIEGIEALARYRGVQCGVAAAEAFQPVRVMMEVAGDG